MKDLDVSQLMDPKFICGWWRAASWRQCRLQPIWSLQSRFFHWKLFWAWDVDPCREAGEASLWERQAYIFQGSCHDRCQAIQYYWTWRCNFWEERLPTVACHPSDGKQQVRMLRLFMTNYIWLDLQALPAYHPSKNLHAAALNLVDGVNEIES